MRKLALLLTLTLVLVSCASKAPSPKKESRLEDQKSLALASYYRKNYKQALEDLEEAERIDRKDPEIFNIRGIIFFSLKDYETAEKAYTKAVSLDKKYSEARFNLCGLYLTLNRWEDAIEHCSVASEDVLYKSRDRAFTGLGVAYYHKGLESGSNQMIELAERAFNNALAINPVLVYTFNERGKMYMKLGLEDDAIASFKQAIAGFDRYDEAHYNLAQVYLVKGYSQLACRHFKRVYELSPNSSIGLNAKGYINSICGAR